MNQIRRRWRRKNPLNDTIPANVFNLSLVKVGKYSYGELNVFSSGKDARLKIGHFVSIGQHVSFILQMEHHSNYVSTYPFKVKVLKAERCEAFSKGDIVVDDDVWLGYGATIMSGVHIGQGAIVAAGAVVTKNIPPYAIVGGIPAKIIRFRFNAEIVRALMQIDYSQVTKELIDDHIKEFYSDLKSAEDVDAMSWLPKKGD